MAHASMFLGAQLNPAANQAAGSVSGMFSGLMRKTKMTLSMTATTVLMKVSMAGTLPVKHGTPEVRRMKQAGKRRKGGESCHFSQLFLPRHVAEEVTRSTPVRMTMTKRRGTSQPSKSICSNYVPSLIKLQEGHRVI